MGLRKFLKETNLEHTLLLGYYGGGNYGDELLLEVLQNLLHAQKVQNVSIAYQAPDKFKEFHHDFGYKLISFHHRLALIKAGIQNKSIIVGGGGLWGVDMNLNTLLMSLYLFINRFFFGKKIFLVGVGYYNSTNRMGHIGAWLAAKAANQILARDHESQQNFARFTKRVQLDHDMAWYIDDINLSAYEPDLDGLTHIVSVTEKTLFVTLRRSQSKNQHAEFESFSELMANVIKTNQDKRIIIGMLESEEKSPEEFALARKWKDEYKNVQVIDTPLNPLTLYLFFKKYKKMLALIGPQFHIIITAHLNQVPFLPVVYDNKVRAMLNKIGIDDTQHKQIHDLGLADTQQFIDTVFERAAA